MSLDGLEVPILMSLPQLSYRCTPSLWEAESWKWKLMGEREARHFCLSPELCGLHGLQL